MNYPDEMLPYGDSPVGMFNWSARDQFRGSLRGSGTEPVGMSIEDLSSRTRHIRLGNGEYFGGKLSRQGSELPIVVSGNVSRTMVKSPLRVEEASAYIYGVTFVAAGDGAPVLEISNGARVTVKDCVFRFVGTTDNYTVTMDSTSKMVISGCHFYGGKPTPRIVDNPGVLANLIIATSYRGYGSAWSTSFSGIGNI